MYRLYINDKLCDEYGCDSKIRRMCDSFYIKKYNAMKKAYDDLLKQFNELKEENYSYKQLLEVYHIYLKGGEEDGSRRHETIK